MGYGARQVTDGQGNRYFALTSNTTKIGLYEKRELHQSIEGSEMTTGKLCDVTHDRYSQLVMFLIEREKRRIDEPCEYGYKRATKWIQFKGCTYWTNGKLIHEHKRNKKDVK